jgi:hypothetical protein
MEVRQLSFCGLAAARCSSWATTSTTPSGLAAGEAVGASLALAGVAPRPTLDDVKPIHQSF